MEPQKTTPNPTDDVTTTPPTTTPSSDDDQQISVDLQGDISKPNTDSTADSDIPPAADDADMSTPASSDRPSLDGEKIASAVGSASMPAEPKDMLAGTDTPDASMPASPSDDAPVVPASTPAPAPTPTPVMAPLPPNNGTAAGLPPKVSGAPKGHQLMVMVISLVAAMTIAVVVAFFVVG